MSNDELQKAIDDITKGDAAAASASSSSAMASDSGTASVPLPEEMTAGAPDANLNFTETPDTATGAPEDIFGAAPPTPDTSSVMPTGMEEPTTNPATEAAPSVPEPLGADPLAGFDPESVTSNAIETENVAKPEEADTATAAAPVEVKTPEAVGDGPTEIPTIGTLEEKPVDLTETAPAVGAMTGDVVSEAKKELYPLLDKVPSMSDAEKCSVCIEVGGDALPKALQYAKNIPDETEKAEALVKIIEKAS